MIYGFKNLSIRVRMHGRKGCFHEVVLQILAAECITTRSCLFIMIYYLWLWYKNRILTHYCIVTKFPESWSSWPTSYHHGHAVSSKNLETTCYMCDLHYTNRAENALTTWTQKLRYPWPPCIQPSPSSTVLSVTYPDKGHMRRFDLLSVTHLHR